jgi:hypothetical protein
MEKSYIGILGMSGYRGCLRSMILILMKIHPRGDGCKALNKPPTQGQWL